MSFPNVLRRTTFAALAFAIAGVGVAQALTIELKDVAADRVERQRAAAAGALPLPGTPNVAFLQARLRDKGVTLADPILIRIFKAESELEIWKQKGGGYILFATYPICHWSGTLGPKLKSGDKQAPEGFYTVTRRQLHHAGRWPRSLNLGFPNVFDKTLSRTGSYILVHGGCSSVGCYAMTNTVIEEIYSLTAAAISGGEDHVPVHVFPFRMTDANLAKYKTDEWHDFWSNLKEGYDAFQRTRRPPRVSVCDGRYHFRDIAPEEGGEPGPLGWCGATAPAVQDLERLSKLASLRPSVWLRPQLLEEMESRLSRLVDLRSRNGALAKPPSRATLAAVMAAEPQDRPGPSLAQVRQELAARAARLTPAAAELQIPPPCSLRLASCRKHMALARVMEQKRVLAQAASHRRRARTAANAR